MSDTRERIVEATATLFMQQGYSASGLKAIAVAGEATTGSVYHFFPGGKAELAAATLRLSGARYGELVMAILDAAPDIVTGTRDCFAGAAEVLQATDFVDACPIATVALEVASSDDALRQVTAEIFDGWLEAATERIAAEGVSADRARDLATLFIAALEGGFLLSRSAKDTTAMERLGRVVVTLVESEVLGASVAAAPSA